ncbi:gliding motility-associated C-terminal domain-containing protein [Pontimicrobium aquaticum]|uniref:Gliding motility-associated C-terminal domain-containing protein n=1 Tax=Pontimicrobium aquaticum TaxID=2565367 RepID=A0A4U0ES33_9FLAO|nr:gliding motility-associated C-terminal domain-containing protein [Pontimicrobium aquaticum]TJY34024.1 gliding motility-associated C-terminal domain-containing protein [Pontimicrobium aquaticum]
MKTTATLVILICFNVLTMFGQQAGGESADWPKRTESARERVAFETLLKKRALKYNAQKAMSLRSSASTPSLVGTCNVITCGGFGLGDVTPNYSWGGFKTAVDGSTYAANVAYDCWDDNGTVDYSEGQYISYSNSDANIDTPGIISPSPDGGGFAIFSYKNEAIEQDLTVLPNTNYTVCFEIAVIPRYNNSNGNFDEFNPNLSFGIGSGGTVISDPLTYTHNDLNIHPVGDFPPKLTTATSGNSGFQNPGGWTEINPFWETVCITFKSDNSGNVNVFYKTGSPGESVVLVDGLRLSMEGYANPPKFTSTVNNTKSVVFCQPETTNLNDYISPSSIQPSGSVLTWSTNVDPLATSYHLTNTNVTAPGTYYAFYYNDVDNCASPVAQLNLLLSDFDAKIVAKTDVTCEGDTSGVIVAEGLNGTEPYTYSIDGGSNYQNSGIFSGLTDGDYTITVKDDNNCTVEVSATILSEDKENPIIEAPANYTIEGCDTKDIKDLIYSDTQEEISLGELQSALDGGGNASDDIAIDTITYIDEVVSSNSCTIEVKRTFTVTDTCGKTATDVQIIIIEDTIAPKFVETLPKDLKVECDAVPTAEVLTAKDNCSEAKVTFKEERTDGACDSEYTLIRTWTAADECGNSVSHKQTITVEDNTAPTFVEALPADATAECDNIPEAATLTATDNCDASVTVSFSESTSGDDDACPSEYTITRTWTVSDCAGNETSHTQTITVEDNTAPTFVEALPADATAECDNIPEAATLTATDNCDASVTVSFSESTSGDDDACPSEYTITRTWTVSDCAGNETSHTQTITVEDNTAPTFVEALPADATAECDNIPEAATLTATDNCDASVTVAYDEQRTDGSCPSNYILVRTWSVIDCAGNTNTHVQNITVEDTTVPTIDVEANDIMIQCDGSGNSGAIQAWLDSNGGASASDNCGTVTWTNNYSGATSNCADPIEVIFTATDECGNTATTTATYTIMDETAPTIDIEASDLTVQCDGLGNDIALQDWLNANGGASATDDCSTITWSNDFTGLSDNCGATGSATVTFTVSDSCGNESSTTATFTIEDITAPTFVEALPENVTVECDAVPTAETLTATDNCGDATVTFNETRNDGDCESNYTLVRTWTATDACGLETVHTQTITVQDTTAPTFVEALPENVTVECDAVPTTETLTATDNCGDATVTFNETRNDGDCESNYTLVRTWTATDACGLETVHTQTITVQDTTAPTFVEALPEDATVECNTVLPTAETLTATDNCDSNFIKVEYNEIRTDGSCGGNYILTRTWTAMDLCGNVAEHTQIITVQDTTAPIVTTEFESEITVNCGEIPSVPELEFEDNCASQIDVTFNETDTNDGSGSNFVITREWTVSDECDNTAIFTQTINVNIETNVTGGSTDLCIGDDFEYDLFQLLSGDYGTNGTWEVTSGNATLNENFFNPYELELGEYRFTYTDSEGECPSETEVIITLNDACIVLPCLDAFDPDQHIPKAVTANGDDNNDRFEIDVLDSDSECFDVTMELQIFNRWGALIYESKDYQNNWGGESHNSSVGSSGKVPTGTYYYILRLIENGELIASYAGPIYVGTK